LPDLNHLGNDEHRLIRAQADRWKSSLTAPS
jgi:hypothetical protein